MALFAALVALVSVVVAPGAAPVMVEVVSKVVSPVVATLPIIFLPPSVLMSRRLVRSVSATPRPPYYLQTALLTLTMLKTEVSIRLLAKGSGPTLVKDRLVPISVQRAMMTAILVPMCLVARLGRPPAAPPPAVRLVTPRSPNKGGYS